MTSSALKSHFRLPIYVTVMANLAAFYIMFVPNIPQAAALPNSELLFPAFLGILANVAVLGTTTSEMKARLVFWRWTDPLPGCQAFSVHAKADSRIDRHELRRKIGSFPRDAAKQNISWYKIYLSVGNTPPVQDALRKYLFSRDYTVAGLVFCFTLGPAAYFLLPDKTEWRFYLSLLALQYMCARQMAEIYGIRLVTSTLAVKAAE